MRRLARAVQGPRGAAREARLDRGIVEGGGAPRRGRRRHRPAGGQHEPLRRLRARRVGHPGDRQRLAHEPRARHRPRQQHDHGRGRLHPRRPAARGDGERPVLPPVARRGGQLRGGRQHLHQRRRNAGAALRQHARAGAGPRGGAARRARVGRPARAAQGQHRLRPEAPLHRRRGHAGHRDRGRAQALSEAARRRHGARGGARPGRVGGAAGEAAQRLRRARHRLRAHRARLLRPRLQAHPASRATPSRAATVVRAGRALRQHRRHRPRARCSRRRWARRWRKTSSRTR